VPRGRKQARRKKMEGESRAKTFWMVLSLAAFVGLGTACFGLLRSTPTEECARLEGQARIDCEQRRNR
jgi:hypothetical protein